MNWNLDIKSVSFDDEEDTIPEDDYDDEDWDDEDEDFDPDFYYGDGVKE